MAYAIRSGSGRHCNADRRDPVSGTSGPHRLCRSGTVVVLAGTGLPPAFFWAINPVAPLFAANSPAGALPFCG